MTLYPQLIMDALATVMYAGTKKNVVESGMVADTPSVAAPAAEGDPWRVKVVLEFPRDTDPFLKSTVKAAEAAIKYHCGQDVEVTIDSRQLPVPRLASCCQASKTSSPSAQAREASARAPSLPTLPSPSPA